MAKRRKKNRKKNSNNDSIAIMAVELFVFLIAYLIIILVGIIKLIYNVISFYVSGYKKKSGNGFFKTFFDKGLKGEFILYKILVKEFGKQFVFTNLYLDNVNTDKTEVDVLAISNKKVYVFEMKNYRGYVYGSEKDVYWTQVFNRFSKYKFFNPLRQNYAHTKAVENYLEMNLGNIEPVVVFSNSSKLNKINVNETSNVIQIKELRNFIRNNEKNSQEIFTPEEKRDLASKVILTENVSDDVKAEHIKQVNELVSIQAKSEK